MELLEMLEAFCPPLGAPGREDEIREALAEWLQPRVRRLEEDRLGNLQAWLGPDEGPRVMLDAHMDETAFLVQRVEDSGALRLAPLGGVDPRIVPGSRAILQIAPGQHLPAVVGLTPPHVLKAADQEKAVPWESLYLDAGFSSAAQAAQAGVRVGTCGVLDAGQGRLAGDIFRARNLDDRAGCVALLAVIQRLAGRELPVELVFNFSVAEEVGLRGAATAAYGLKPHLALVVETTVGDTPGVEPAKHPSLLGKGPAITVADGRIVVPQRLVDSLEAAADKAGVACQRKLPPYGGTDAGAIHVSRRGVPTCIVSVPTRYIHTPVSLLDLKDLAATVELVMAWLDGVESLL